jgi:hypothetical protein
MIKSGYTTRAKAIATRVQAVIARQDAAEHLRLRHSRAATSTVGTALSADSTFHRINRPPPSPVQVTSGELLHVADAHNVLVSLPDPPDFTASQAPLVRRDETTFGEATFATNMAVASTRDNAANVVLDSPDSATVEPEPVGDATAEPAASIDESPAAIEKLTVVVTDAIDSAAPPQAAGVDEASAPSLDATSKVAVSAAETAVSAAETVAGINRSSFLDPSMAHYNVRTEEV